MSEIRGAGGTLEGYLMEQATRLENYLMSLGGVTYEEHEDENGLSYFVIKGNLSFSKEQTIPHGNGKDTITVKRSPPQDLTAFRLYGERGFTRITRVEGTCDLSELKLLDIKDVPRYVTGTLYLPRWIDHQHIDKQIREAKCVNIGTNVKHGIRVALCPGVKELTFNLGPAAYAGPDEGARSRRFLDGLNSCLKCNWEPGESALSRFRALQKEMLEFDHFRDFATL